MNENITVSFDVYKELMEKNVIYETLKNLLIDNVFISDHLMYSLFGLDKKKD